MAEGRRKRVREKYWNAGINALALHEAIEAFLYQFDKRKDTGDLGRSLLKQFSNLYEVFNAKEEDLLKVKGLPRLAAFYISRFNDVIASSNNKVDTLSKTIINVSDAEDIFNSIHTKGEDSAVHVIFLDINSKVITCTKVPYVNVGNLNKEITKNMINTNAYAAIGVYYRPNLCANDPMKTEIDDVNLLYNHLRGMGVSLSDFIITCPNCPSFSFYHAGLIDTFKELYEKNTYISRPK